MKRIAFIFCCIFLGQIVYGQVSGGQIVRNKSNKQIQSTHKPTRQNTKKSSSQKQFNHHDNSIFKYDEVIDFYGGMAMVRRGGLYGFIDNTGREVIPCNYYLGTLRNFHEDLAAIQMNYKWGFIDKTGREVIPCKYEGFSSYLYYWSRSNYECAKLHGKWGVIDKNGYEVIPFRYDYIVNIDNISEGLAAVKLNGKYIFIDKTGREVIPCKYEEVHWSSSDGLTLVKLNGKLGFIDKYGREVIPCKYEATYPWAVEPRSLIPLKLNGKWGFVDKTGQVVIPFKYEYAEGFYEGFAVVKYGGKWGFIDETGKPLVLKGAK